MKRDFKLLHKMVLAIEFNSRARAGAGERKSALARDFPSNRETLHQNLKSDDYS